MNVQPSEAEVGFDLRLPPTTDIDLLKKRIEEEWAPSIKNLTYKVRMCWTIGEVIWCKFILIEYFVCLISYSFGALV